MYVCKVCMYVYMCVYVCVCVCMPVPACVRMLARVCVCDVCECLPLSHSCQTPKVINPSVMIVQQLWCYATCINTPLSDGLILSINGPHKS